MTSNAVRAAVLDQPFVCRVCGGNLFWVREVKLNSTGAEFFGFAWANQSATGLICHQCGFVHEFVGTGALRTWADG